LHLGIDHRGNLELFRGEIHGWTYIRFEQTQLQPLRKFRFNNHPMRRCQMNSGSVATREARLRHARIHLVVRATSQKPICRASGCVPSS
jgi:hypothetical protein